LRQPVDEIVQRGRIGCEENPLLWLKRKKESGGLGKNKQAGLGEEE
jgi:hypothetical protein